MTVSAIYLSVFVILIATIPQSYAQSPIMLEVNTATLTPGEIVEITGSVDKSLANQPVAVEIRDSEGNVILIRTVTPDSDGKFSLKFKVPVSIKPGEFDITANVESDGLAITETKSIMAESEPESQEPVVPKCGPGTVEKDGVCVPATTEKTSDTKSGGGCLIATATYGSELAPQVQLLREVRDNAIFGTRSGTTFMAGFNEFYYSFSPYVADLERQNPLFKELVKVTIMPMMSSLSILNYVDIDSEKEVLAYGIAIISLNAGIYFGIPAFVIVKIRKLNHRKYQITM